MAKMVDQGKKRPSVKSDKKPNPLKSNTSDNNSVNLSMDETVTKFAKSNYNPTAEEFEYLVDNVRKAIRKEVDYRKSVGDASPVSISKYTNEAIKRELRSSKWV